MAHNGNLVCPNCLSINTERRGQKQMYCRDCKTYPTIARSLELMNLPQSPIPKHFSETPFARKYFEDREAPNVLVFDIETLPIIGTFWETGKIHVGIDNILEDWCVLSWSAKMLFSNEVIGDILTPAETQTRLMSVITRKDHDADFRIVKRIWKLLDEADVVITQNGKKFDARKLNARFIYYGLVPPRPYHHIDTLEAANAAFGTTSKKLAYMTAFLKLPRKMETDYQLWLGCMYGDKDSLQRMYDYGLNDTWILEDYYAAIRAWIPKHPNFSAYTNKYVDLDAGEHQCPVCRTPISKEKVGEFKRRTPLGFLYSAFRCSECGAIGRRTNRVPGQSIPVQLSG